MDSTCDFGDESNQAEINQTMTDYGAFENNNDDYKESAKIAPSAK
jgi:hypothetical protein